MYTLLHRDICPNTIECIDSSLVVMLPNGAIVQVKYHVAMPSFAMRLCHASVVLMFDTVSYYSVCLSDVLVLSTMRLES